MLSYAQEARVLTVIRDGLFGARMCCLDHLAIAAKVPSRKRADLTAFVRALRMMGDCETERRGFCDMSGHETNTLLIRRGDRPSP
jgi:hypothetical protein